MPEWVRPSKKELFIEAVFLLVLPIYSVVNSWREGKSQTELTFVGLGVLALTMVIVAIAEIIRSPYRRRRMTDRQLEQALLQWVRRAGYGISAPVSIPDAVFAVGATFGDATIWIIKASQSPDSLHIATQRIDTGRDIQQALTPGEWAAMLFDVLLEVGRYGAGVQLSGGEADGKAPLTVTISETVSVEAPLTERDLVDRVGFVRRADWLGMLTVRKHHTAKQFASSAPTTTGQPASGTPSTALLEILKRWTVPQADDDSINATPPT